LIERCFVLGVLGRGVLVALRRGVGHLGLGLLQAGQLLGRAAHDPDRLASPLDGELLAGLQGADVDLDRRAGGLGALGRREGADEGHRGGQTPDRTGAAGDGDPGAARWIGGVDIDDRRGF
jgi:hypothetical protein